MPQIQVESLSKAEDDYVRELAESYVNVDLLDFQDVGPVQEMAKTLLRYRERLVGPPAPQKAKFINP